MFLAITIAIAFGIFGGIITGADGLWILKFWQKNICIDKSHTKGISEEMYHKHTSYARFSRIA